MGQTICTVNIKKIFQVIVFVTCGSLKDLLSIFTRKWLVLHYVTPIKRIREQSVSAHLLFFIFQIIVRVWIRFWVGVKIILNVRVRAKVRVCVSFRVGVRDRIAIFNSYVT